MNIWMLLSAPVNILCAGLIMVVALSFLYQSSQEQMKRVSILAVILVLVLACFCQIFYIAYPEALHRAGFKFLLLFAAICFLLAALLSRHLQSLCSMEFLILFQLSIIGGFFALSATNWIQLFVALELQVLPVYLLVGLSKKASSLASCLKYFILGGLSSCFLLLGISFIYGGTGTLDLSLTPEITNVVNGNSLSAHPLSAFTAFGVLLVFAALLFKLSIVPFHAWTADIYAVAHSGIILFLATISKVASWGVLVILWNELGNHLQGFLSPFLSSLAVLSIIVGALSAMRQQHIKKMLAYSTISHMGYLLCLFGDAGDSAIVIENYVFLYITSVCLVLLCLSYMEFDKTKNAFSFGAAKAIYQKHPFIGVLLACSLFSLGGVPPFPLFFGKLALIGALVDKSAWLLVASIIFGSIIGIYYYLRLVKAIFLEQNEEEALEKK